MPDELTPQQIKEQKELREAEQREAAEQARKEKNAKLRAKEQAKKESAEDRARRLLPPGSLVELESEARTRARYMKRVASEFPVPDIRTLAHEAHNRVPRIRRYRERYEESERDWAICVATGQTERLPEVKDEMLENLKTALLHWYAAGEYYRDFKKLEQNILRGQSGNQGTN